MKVKSESEVTQSCPTLRDPMDCSLPGSSVHGILQASVLEWVAIAFPQNAFGHVQMLVVKLEILSLFDGRKRNIRTSCQGKLAKCPGA